MKDKKPENTLLDFCKVLDSDYIEYGGKITRWLDPDSDHNDCGDGCKHFIPLYNEMYKGAYLDFGVCTNSKSKRCGLLTFEHQGGYGCFEMEKLK